MSDKTTDNQTDTSKSAREAFKRPINVAVVGATGVVGRELVELFDQRQTPLASVRLLASSRSAGETMTVQGDDLVVAELADGCFDGVDVVFFAAGSGVARRWAPKAAEAGALSIDKSSAFRLDDDVPLLVPEINGHLLGDLGARRLVATPNCSTIPLVQVLHPLSQRTGIKRVVAATYQAVSGAGRDGIDELESQVRGLFNLKGIESTTTFGKQIAFNVLPAIPGNDGFDDDGVSQEERKMVDETRKILGWPDFAIGVTCVRVPVFHGHSEAIHLELEDELSPDDVRQAISTAPHVMVLDKPQAQLYPTPIDAAGEDVTCVGRIRRDTAFENGIALWLSSDNLRTGAALNALRIAETFGALYVDGEPS